MSDLPQATGGVLSRWFDRSPARFGRLTVAILIVYALVLALLPPVLQPGERSDRTATIIGWWPEAVLRAEVTQHVARGVLAVSALAWLFGRGLPWSAWATAASFTTVWALRMENVSNGAHIFHLTTMLLWVHAAWMHDVRAEWGEARRSGELSSRLLYPRWVFNLSIFQIGLFHTWAGITKIVESGFDWGNGLSLQLWIHRFGWEASPFGQLVLYDRRIAAALQSGALVIETLSFLCWFGPRLRLVVGLCLLGFYTGVLGTFVDYGFHFNWILVAWFLLPVEAALNRARRS